MDPWMTILAALGPGLAKALYDVGQEIVVKPLMGPAAEQVEAWVRHGYDARVDDDRIRRAVEAAAKAAGPIEREDWANHPLISALSRMAGKGHGALRQQAVAAALAMTENTPEQVPDNLLRVLKVPENLRSDLACFLWTFREALVEAGEDYRALVELAHQDAVRAHLQSLASTVVPASTGFALQVVVVSPEAREIEDSYLNTLVGAELRYLPLEGRRVQSSEGGLKMHLENIYIALNTTERVVGMARERGGMH